MNQSILSVTLIAGHSTTLQFIREAFQSLALPVRFHEIPFEDFSNAENAIGALQTDCVIIDMAVWNACEKKSVKLQQPVILCTTSRQEAPLNHAPIFEVLPVPVTNGSFKHVMEKLLSLKNYFQQHINPPGISVVNSGEKNKTFVVKKGKEFQPVHSKQITVFYSENKVTFGLDEKGNKFIIPYTLIELENELNNHMFFRANRQFIVNRNFIQKIKQQDDNRFEIIMNETEKPKVDISYQGFSKLKHWLES